MSSKRREHILDEATRLFAERGFDGTSMSDLAESVGLRKASLFHHFASKDDLKAAVLDRLVTDVGAAILRALKDEGDFATRVDTLTDAIVDVLAQQPFAARLVVREAMDWHTGAPPPIVESIFTILVAAEQFVDAGRAAGAFGVADSKHAISTLIGVHFMPFAITAVTERMFGETPFSPAFGESRKRALREQVRGLLLVR